jgi:hypothetical protein
VLFRMLNRFRTDPLRTQVEDSIAAGTGLRKGEWMLPAGGSDPEQLHEIAETIVSWCREQMSGTRKPYGVDQLTLAVACAVPAGTPIASATFGVFRPIDFHGEDGIASRVVAFVDGLAEQTDAPSSPLRLAAVLFSWGDVARDTIYRDEDIPAAS